MGDVANLNPTLGELEAAAKLSCADAEGYERFLGAGWRTVTLQEAQEDLAAGGAADQQNIAALNELAMIVEKLRERVDRGEPLDNALVAKVTRELYGENPAPGAIDAVLTIVKNLTRRRQGETPDSD